MDGCAQMTISKQYYRKLHLRYQWILFPTCWANFNHQMELDKTELVSSQKGCYVKQHISKFGLIQNLDKMKYCKSPVCVYFTHVRHQMRKNCYVSSVNLGRPEIRIFCDKLLRGTQIWAEIHIFRPKGNGCVLLWLPGPTKIPLIYGRHNKSWKAVSQILH